MPASMAHPVFSKGAVAVGAIFLLSHRGRGLLATLKLPVPREGEPAVSRTALGAAILWAADRATSAPARPPLRMFASCFLVCIILGIR